ncbi:MAG: hypothetical protein RI957_1317 [Verrucomicrobiota bacterium]
MRSNDVIRMILMIRYSLIFFMGQVLTWADPISSTSEGSDSIAKSQEKPAGNPAEKPKMLKLADGRMKYGEIEFDPKTRQVRIPCSVNMNDGLLEFAVVHENGKIHESLLITQCSPTDINVVMKLLRYVASEELYAIEKEPGVLTDRFPEVAEATKKAARVNLSIEWQQDGKAQKAALADWIIQAATNKPMNQEPWVYGGSMVYDGAFLAEQTGDIASIFVSRGSLLLYPGKDNFNDEAWLAHTKRMPAQGTKVHFIIQPLQP